MAAHVGTLPRTRKKPEGLTGFLITVIDYMTTVDHKRIGVMYLGASFVFLLVGGLEALLIRTQLGASNLKLIAPDLYNQLFTMHGTTMVFMAVMPFNAGFGNYFLPIMVGARDMAYPRLNALSLWTFLFGGLFMYASFLLGGAPNAGWFSYAPLTESNYSVTHGMDFWVLGLQMLGVSSTLGAINFIVTALNLRAPGMRINRMPLFVWMTVVTSFLLVLSLPSVSIAMILLLFDRNLGTNFYIAKMGGDPLLWQHLFWFFGHPEVYVMILPAMGIISEVLPTFARKPIFGYSFVAYSGIAIGFLGFTVWAHHMFAVGMPPIVNAAFSLGSMLIGVPTGVKIFNWIGTLWGGNIRYSTAMLFAIGFIGMFVIGGIGGVFLGSPPVDYQITDTYFVVGHLHYVLVGGALVGIMSGFYYWFPKMTGRLLSEALGKTHFVLWTTGITLTFLPMHLLGILGMPRRIYTYYGDMGWDTWNLIQTFGAYLIGAGALLFLFNVLKSLRSGEVAGNDPWDGATLEWATSSPPPAYNFATTPIVGSRRPYWDHKHGGQGDSGAALEMGAPEHIHLPSPSIWPMVLAFGVMVAMTGMLYMKDLAESWAIGDMSVNPVVVLLGVVIVLFAAMNWQNEVSAGK
ncbi:MAG: cytochrome c oxidase subunit I [Chloroflexi bacterium]|nr:cytochrome c oxidase subunit I [Chloroflexota bacterium]